MDLAPLLTVWTRLPASIGTPVRRVGPSAKSRLAMLRALPLVPMDEPQRLAELRELAPLDSAADEELATIVELASRLCGTPMAALSMVDDKRQWYRARCGVPVSEIPRERGLCSRAILGEERVLEIPDTAQVAWFDPQLHGPRSTAVRFYAGAPLRVGQGTPIGTLCVMDQSPRRLTDAQRDGLEMLARTASSQLTLRRDLRIATQTDRLTGLPNWVHFEAQFNATSPQRGVVCFVRLKALSQINSAHGFRVADEMVQQAARRMRAIAEGGAFIGRIKRGLFLLFFPEAEPDIFARVTAPLINAQLQAPYSLGDLTLVCPVHLGFAAYPRDGATLEAVVNAADTALQLAIERDEPSASFDRAVDTATRTHYRLEPQLRTALAQGHFVNHYQPKVELATGRILGVEALIRWMHPDRGVVPPGEFVPALEATGLIRDVGRHMLQRAVRDWCSWRDAGVAAPRVAVNVAVAQLRDPAFVQDLRDALAQADNDPSALSVEVTESVLISNMQQAIDVLTQVRELGVPVAIDDFGTGYSSLSYIVTLPVDEVKIDRSFIRRIATDAAYRGIVGTCINLAHNLRLTVVAEGVETEAQARELVALQCDMAQGFLYSQPLAADELARLLRGA